MVLELRDVRTEITTPRGVVVPVDGVSLRVEAGETLGLVGESGCGKTLTAMSVAGLLPEGGRVVAGAIELGGRDLLRMASAERRAVTAAQVGVVFQNPMSALNPRLSVGAQLREALPGPLRRRRRTADDRAVELLATVGISQPDERLADYPHELSGGLAQRVVIAMALAREPRLLVADEPTTALDVSVQAQLLDLLDHLRLQFDLGVLLITHDLAVVAERAQRVAVMYAGRIVEEGDVRALLDRPTHHYTDALVRSVPSLAGPLASLRPIEGAPPDLADPPAGCRFAARCAAATNVCREQQPPTSARPGPGHRSACWHPIEAPADERSGAEAPDGNEPGPFVATAPPGGEPVVAVRGVSRAFAVQTGFLGFGVRRRRHAVSDVSLELAPGESLGIVGESGCGKSTLARLVVGLDRPDTGTVTHRGRDVSQLDAAGRRQWRRNVQFVFQDPYSSLDPRMRVADIVAAPLVVAEGRGDHRRRVEALLVEVGLTPAVADRRPGQLSGGQRQRVGIARALALDPEVIVADEAVSALDVSVQATILNLLRRLQHERGLSYLFISHDLGVVRYVCNRVAVMYLGTVVESGPTEEIFRNPRHPYTAALLRSVPGGAAGDRLTGELPSAEDPPSGCRFRTRCPIATARCAEQRPLRSVVDGDHAVACHHPLVDGRPVVDDHEALTAGR